MVDYIPNRIYTIDMHCKLPMGLGSSTHSVHKVIGLDTMASREFFEILGDIYVPRPQNLYAGEHFVGLNYSIGISPHASGKRFDAINEIIQQESEENLAQGVLNRFTSSYLKGLPGYLEEVIIRSVPDKGSEELVLNLHQLLEIDRRLRSNPILSGFFDRGFVNWNIRDRNIKSA